MRLLGLTGPTGAGKGEVCRIFAKYGIPSIDTDAVYHTLLAEGGSIVTELTEAFGKDILTNGLIDRKKLGAAVFGHPDTPDRLYKLNTITHKYVLERSFATAKTLLQNGAMAVLIDAPQLFEAHLERDCELVIGVLAERSVRLSRILARDGITEEAAMKRIAAQRSDDFFRENCHVILENNGDLAALEAQVRTFLKDQGMLSPTEEHK